MNPWVAALIGAGVMYVIACIVTLVDELWLDEKFTAVFCGVAIVLMFIPCMMWGMFRHVITPVTVSAKNRSFVQETIADSKEVFPGLYFHHDKKAQSLPHRYFLFRLKKN